MKWSGVVILILRSKIASELQMWRRFERLLQPLPVGNYVVECKRN